MSDLSRQQAKFLSSYVSDLLAERPDLATAGEEAWCAAVTHFEFDAQTGIGERRVIRRLLADGLFKYADEREDHVALAFSPAGAKMLHALHSKPKAGAPRSLEDGRPIKLYLDDASIEKAKSLGQGNMSKGIRFALASHQSLLQDAASRQQHIDNLLKVATGEVAHVFAGLCPDVVAGFASRDDQCPACKLLMLAKAGTA